MRTPAATATVRADRSSLSFSLIHGRTGPYAERYADLFAQVTYFADLVRMQVNRLGKRVGGNPSRVRIPHPPRF